MTFKKGDRVRQIDFPDKPATVLQDALGDGWIAVQFDCGGGVFGNGVVDVPPEALELVPNPRNWTGRGVNRASRLGRIFDAAAEACAVDDTALAALVSAIEGQAPRQRLLLADVRRALAAWYYGGASSRSYPYPYRVLERMMNRMDAQKRAAAFREAADFYRGGN